MKLRAFLATVFMMVFCSYSFAGEVKAYCVYVDDTKTVTIYYDDKMDSRPGTEKCTIQDRGKITDGPTCLRNRDIVERVVIDSSFKNSKFRSTTGWFSYMEKIKSIEGLQNIDFSKIVYATSMFGSCKSLESLDLSSYEMPELEYAESMFMYCTNLKSIKLFKTSSNLHYIKSMFSDCYNLTSIDLTPLVTSGVKDMASMFDSCFKLTSLNLSKFDTSNVTDMIGVFYQCGSLEHLDLSSFNTSKVTMMQEMFRGCNNLQELDLTHFDTSTVTNMEELFLGCDNLKTLDLSSWNTSKVVAMDKMFADCRLLKTIYVGNGWTTEKVRSSYHMFSECVNLKGGAGTPYDMTHIDVAYAHIDGGTSNPGYFTEPMYDLWVGGIQVKGRNQSDVLGDGKVSYLPGSKKLKLNNATITLTGFDNCIMNDNPRYVNGGIDGLTIEVEGICKLNAEASAILINQNTTITGNGELIVKSNGDAAVNVNQSILTCEVKRLYAYAIKEGLVGDFGYNTKLVINGSTLECYTNTPNTFKPIKGFYSMTLTNCHFADPGGEWKYADASKFSYSTNNNGGVLFNGSDYRGKVLIEPNTAPTKYRLWVGETRVTSANKNNIGGLVSGTAVFNSDTHTLTLNSAVIRIDRYDDGIANGLENLEGMPDFKIVCKGTNSIETEGNGLSLYGNTTISGSKLSVKTGNYGVYLDDFKELTLQDADVYTEAPNPICCGYNTFVYVRHSQLEANPGTSQNSPVEGAREFDLFDCKYADPGIGINPAYLYYNEEEKMIYYDRSPYKKTLLVVPTGNISTDIDQVTSNKYQVTSDDWYTMDGRKLSGKPNAKGIYIHNGKKVLK